MKQNRVQLRADDAGKAADNQQSEPMAVDTASVAVTDGVRGCLFDLDGVITKTAAQSGGRFVPFDAVADGCPNWKIVAERLAVIAAAYPGIVVTRRLVENLEEHRRAH